MQCRKCHAQIPDASKFCNLCGVKQDVAQNPKSRGNGQGTVYQLPNKSWKAVYTVGYFMDAEGKKHRKIRTKAGFKTKRDAINYLPQLRQEREAKNACTLQQLYDRWQPTHRAGASTMGNYKAAFNYFRPLWSLQVAVIDIDDLQDCVDDCPRGKRTRENMKALCGLLYKYAIPRHIADLDLGHYLIVGGGEDGSKPGIPVEDLPKIKALIGAVPYAEYVYAQCYLGFRPAELLALDVKDYDRERRAFIGGAKTDAGRDRVVPVSPKIQPIIDRLVANKIAGPVFCAKDGSAMSTAAFRDAFYTVLDAAGIENPIVERDGVKYHTYTPHSCRHTFATLMKQVQAPDKDKLELIGHTSTEMLRHYQDVDIDALRRITDAI